MVGPKRQVQLRNNRVGLLGAGELEDAIASELLHESISVYSINSRRKFDRGHSVAFYFFEHPHAIVREQYATRLLFS
jgi:hypothetical protein